MKSVKELLLEAAKCRRLADGTTDAHASVVLHAMAEELEILAAERAAARDENSSNG
jgi:hypothetical protein